MTKKELLKKWNYHRKMVEKYHLLLCEKETLNENLNREIKSWPKWKQDAADAWIKDLNSRSYDSDYLNHPG